MSPATSTKSVPQPDELAPAVEQAVDRRDDQQGQGGRRQQAADHDGGKRRPDLVLLAGDELEDPDEEERAKRHIQKGGLETDAKRQAGKGQYENDAGQGHGEGGDAPAGVIVDCLPRSPVKIDRHLGLKVCEPFLQGSAVPMGEGVAHRSPGLFQVPPRHRLAAIKDANVIEPQETAGENAQSNRRPADRTAPVGQDPRSRPRKRDPNRW